MKVLNEFWPLNASLNSDQPFFGIQCQDPIQSGEIKMEVVRAELLSTHRMLAARNTNRSRLPAGLAKNIGKLNLGTRAKHLPDGGLIQLRLNVIQNTAVGLALG
jgi:hypothetical protein